MNVLAGITGYGVVKELIYLQASVALVVVKE